MNYNLYKWNRDKAKGTVSVSYDPNSDATSQGADTIARSLFPSERKVRLFVKGEYRQSTPQRAIRVYRCTVS